MIKLTDKPLASSSASGDKIFINRNGAIMQVGMSNFSPPIVPTVSGNVIAVTDSSDRPLVDLTVFGNTSQNGTPTPENPIDLVSVENPIVTINGKNLLENKSTSLTTEGITFTVNDDKSVTVKGTPTSNPARYLNANLTLPIGNYVLSGGGTSASVKLIIRITKSGGGYTYIESSGKETLFSVTAENVDLPRIAYIYVSGNEAIDTIIYPMIRLASITDSTYEPYKAQSLSIPYILNEGDYVDFERGVLVRNTVVVNNFTLSDTYTNTKLYRGTTTEDMVAGVVGTAFCTHTNKYVYDTADNVHFFVGKNSIPLYLPIDFNDADLPDVKVIAQLVTPIETPLTDEEIEAFKQLQSYYPTTTITNSENAEMGVEYVADNKNYIDNKLASLVASTTTDTTEV